LSFICSINLVDIKDKALAVTYANIFLFCEFRAEHLFLQFRNHHRPQGFHIFTTVPTRRCFSSFIFLMFSPFACELFALSALCYANWPTSASFLFVCLSMDLILCPLNISSLLHALKWHTHMYA